MSFLKQKNKTLRNFSDCRQLAFLLEWNPNLLCNYNAYNDPQVRTTSSLNNNNNNKMDPEPAAFLEAIKTFASSDFSESFHPELWYWKYILDDAAWRGQQPNDIVDMPLEDNFGRKRNYSSAFDLTAEMLTDQGNLDMVPPALCGNVTDHSEEEEEDVISTVSPSAVARKSARLAFQDDSNSSNSTISNSKKMSIPKSSPISRRIAASPTDLDELAANVTPPETTYAGLAAGTNGENRLRIHFESFGTQGKCPQRFGKSGCLIPDGLRGTHEIYDQHWRFEISHDSAITRDEEDHASVQITWKITNLTSGLVVQVKETPQQAILREYSGRTVCNKVVKMALSARADELEKQYKKNADTMEPTKRISLENNIRVLRPRLCTVGLLFFGLLHDTVQMNLQH